MQTGAARAFRLRGARAAPRLAVGTDPAGGPPCNRDRQARRAAPGHGSPTAERASSARRVRLGRRPSSASRDLLVVAGRPPPVASARPPRDALDERRPRWSRSGVHRQLDRRRRAARGESATGSLEGRGQASSSRPRAEQRLGRPPASARPSSPCTSAVASSARRAAPARSSGPRARARERLDLVARSGT